MTQHLTHHDRHLTSSQGRQPVFRAVGAGRTAAAQCRHLPTVVTHSRPRTVTAGATRIGLITQRPRTLRAIAIRFAHRHKKSAQKPFRNLKQLQKHHGELEVGTIHLPTPPTPTRALAFLFSSSSHSPPPALRHVCPQASSSFPQLTPGPFSFPPRYACFSAWTCVYCNCLC